MSCFKTHITTATATAPDPTKHVNYQLGMVLGVDDFNQEFAYLSGRDQWLARDLIGYGTARGLSVHYENDGTKGPRVFVGAGAALSPGGQLICVPTAQCASLNDWLKANGKSINDRLGSPPSATLPLYVVLCYRECPTDKAPIPGEPCRSEDELTAPSRITDSYQLELRLDAPKQREEDAARDFVKWLRQIEISDSVTSSSPMDQYIQAIRDAAKPWLSQPASPLQPADFMFGSPPAALQIRPEDACEYLNAAFRLWVTELRPKWHGRWHGCAADMPDDASNNTEDCVLLGRVDVPVLLNSPDQWVVSDVNAVSVDDRQRPFIAHLRLLQEWLLCGRSGIGAGFPTDLLIAPVGSPPEPPEPPGVGTRIAVAVVDASTTLNSGHHCVICNTATNPVTITLPPTLFHAGRVYIIKRNGAQACTINSASGDTIDGANSAPLPGARSSLTIIADRKSRTWQVVART